MKKNKLIGILAISAMMGLSGCNFVGIQPSCVHDWSTWDIIEEPTCIQKGSRERFCYKCGKEQTRSIAIDLVYGHSYYENPDDDRPATCTEPGIEGSQICLRCGQKKKGTKSELAGHKYEVVADPGDAKYHPATCTQDGLQQKKCKTCGDIKDEVLTKTGHGDYVVEKNGILGVVKCGKCGDKAGYELDIADAVGFNTPNTKMNATSGASSMSTWDIGSFIGSVIPEGFYDIQLEAAMTNESHAKRKLYNMGRAELQVDDDEAQNGNDNNADKASQAPYRYFLKVNGTEVINPLTKKSYGELGMGVGTANFHYVEFVEGVQIDSTTTTLSLAHGNIGYSLYCRSIRLVPHNHDIEKSVVPSSADTVAHTVEKCYCGYRKVTFNALSGTFANGVVNANDAPEGYLKLASSTDSITYKLNVSENMTGKLYMVGRQTDAYMNQSPYNMKWTYRGEEITGADTTKVTSDFLTNNGADMAGYSKEVKVLVGNITLKDNTFNSGDLVYKRTGDYNIVVSEIVFEGRPAGHIHNYQHTAGDTKDKAGTCIANREEHYVCTLCGAEQYKEVPNSMTDHDWEEKYREDPSCTQDGMVRYECKVCHERKTETLPASHNYVDQGVPEGMKYHVGLCNACTGANSHAATWMLADATIEDYEDGSYSPLNLTSTSDYKTGKTSKNEDVALLKFKPANRRVTLVYQNDGDPINNAMFQIFATTKTGANLDNCQPYRQTIGEGGSKDKFTLTVNNVKVNFADEYLDKSIKDIGLLDVESHIADNGALADPMWLNYYNINLASGTNTIVFETPASSGYSIYIGGFRVTF